MTQGTGNTISIVETAQYQRWFGNLRDRRARSRINQRLERVRQGNFGDVDSVGAGVSEMRVHYGPGYRLYFMREGNSIVVLLCGGDKGTQDADFPESKTAGPSTEVRYWLRMTDRGMLPTIWIHRRTLTCSSRLLLKTTRGTGYRFAMPGAILSGHTRKAKSPFIWQRTGEQFSEELRKHGIYERTIPRILQALGLTVPVAD